MPPVSDTDRFVDLRLLAAADRPPRLLAVLEALVPGDEATIIVDHDPVSLRRQVDIAHPGRFDWHRLEDGPDLWRTVARRRPATTCCGSCGG
ncbi:DUF2249 domain-containing protein [Pinisolibacter aquiterrae]|uniref:DUF2249 domain-containing protein n=1 Tax=Pinisolibacter aquiterrae TaxID=2815579 RepID=UPI001C3D2654|nr:DUF2249 domain-containing protein [Pinisolibacter aquiterrae]MBV5265399.1 DUF2249 domain-containing protein [Pinisolibacter aquiterrae]MCC8235225.1 DUF2249 domain-containing protein [Pinisolibacter aquiterrae]